MTIINSIYKITEPIGRGSFGTVYIANNIRTNEEVAIKIENNNNDTKLIKREAIILNYLYRNNVECIPKLYYYGITNNSTCIVLTLFSCDLLTYIENVNPNTETLYKIMNKCINILQKVHNKNVIHRDVKPQNFMIKNGDIFLIDFGFAYFYKNEEGVHHNKVTESIIGSVKYTSYFNHCGEPSSRRDDLLSLGYMFLSFIEEYLIWDTKNIEFPPSKLEITNINYPKNEFIKNKKKISLLKSICNDKMSTYFEYVYKLTYDGEPNYDFIMS